MKDAQGFTNFDESHVGAEVKDMVRGDGIIVHIKGNWASVSFVKISGGCPYLTNGKYYADDLHRSLYLKSEYPFPNKMPGVYETETVTKWVNVYGDDAEPLYIGQRVFDTKEKAQEWKKDSDYLDTIPIKLPIKKSVKVTWVAKEEEI
jgi:hypothetical protein